AGGVDLPLDAVAPRCLDRVHVDHRVVAHDHGLVGLDEADSAHVGCERVDFFHAGGGFEAVRRFPEVEHAEVVRCRSFVFGPLDIDAAHPVTAVDEILGEMMPDESTCSGNQYFLGGAHTSSYEHGSIARLLG